MSGVRIPEKGWVRRLLDEPLVAWGRRGDVPPQSPDLPPGLIQVGIGENGRPILGSVGRPVIIRGLNDPPDW